MASRGSLQHRKAIIDYLAELEEQGWRTFNLNALSPDGIAVKGNEVIAIEVLLTNNGKCNTTSELKRGSYFMFDKVYVKKIKRDKKEDDRFRV